METHTESIDSKFAIIQNMARHSLKIERNSEAGALLTKARLEKKLSQRELAELAGVPQSTVSRIESGRSDPSLSTLERLLAPVGLRPVVSLSPVEGVEDGSLALALPMNLANIEAQREMGEVGVRTRKVSIPADFAASQSEVLETEVVLPQNLFWSAPNKVWNLHRKDDLVLFYETVMTEGSEADVRRYLNYETLLEIWDFLHLSPHVRLAWASWLAANSEARQNA